jgi:hypothetical protein
MRIWRKIVESLTRSPGGFVADGRTIGLGLSTAMEKSRQNASTEVEDYLRHQATIPAQATRR